MSDTEKFETPATPATTDSQGMKYLESTPRRLVTVYLPLAVFLFVLLFPFYWMTITAFKPNEELLSREGNPFWVINPTLAHIKKLLFDTAYPDWLWNTILVSVVSTLLSLFCSVLAAYAIERLRFRGSRYVGMSIFLAYLVPPSILFIPLAAIIFKFQLFDTRLALILTYPTFLIPFCTWLLMGYFRSIPFELEECALIDGASRLQILVKIILPLAVPGLISAGIFAFTLSWNEFIYALTFVSSSEVKTVPVGVITELVEGDVYHWGALMAGALFGSLAGGDPVFVLRRALRLRHDRRGQGVTSPSRRSRRDASDSDLRRRHRRARRDGQRGRARTVAPRPASPRPRPLHSAACVRFLARRDAHHPRGVLRAPGLRTAGAARLRALAGTGARVGRDAAAGNGRPDDRTTGQRARRRARSAALRLHDLTHEVLTSSEVRRLFPALRPDDDMIAVHEPRAGILFPEACIDALLERARRQGAEVRGDAAVRWWESGTDGLRVYTETGEYRARRLIVCAGAWMNELLPGQELPLRIERQVLHWFEPVAMADQFAPERCPIHLWQFDEGRFFYGFPDLGGGVKAGFHHEGETTTANGVRREVTPAEVESVRSVMRRFLPCADGPPRSSVVCLYTNTPDGHFLIDTHPLHPDVLIASPCSGHGFKFAPVIGEILADLAQDKAPRFDLTLFRRR